MIEQKDVRYEPGMRIGQSEAALAAKKAKTEKKSKKTTRTQDRQAKGK